MMKRAMAKADENDVKDDTLLNSKGVYEDSVLPFEKSLYEKNRILFLLQSALLGISYAIVWPTLWLYVLEFKELDLPAKELLYGSVFVAYPLASMIAAYFIEKTTMDIRLLFVLLNFSGIVGNLIYALNFHPVCLFIGRLFAGVADAFYVLIMRDLKSARAYKGGSIAAECLCGFIVGLVLAQFFNAATVFLPFKLGSWSLSPTNYPGLTASLLFSLMALANRVFLSVTNEDNYIADESTNGSPPSDTKTTMEKQTIFISLFSFIHTYVVSMFEILIPIVLFEKLHASALSSILLYGFVGILYAMILMFVLSVKSSTILECFMLGSVLLKMLGLLAAICVVLVPMTTLHGILAVVAMIVAITFIWSSDDVMYTNIILSLIPNRVRDYTHNLRKTTSKTAFLIAGVTVPFLYSKAILYVGTILTILIGVLFMAFIIMRTFSKVNRGYAN